MRLNVQTDYALRLLMRLALTPDRLVTIAEVAEAYGISRNHLTKVALHLTRCGFVESVRGRSGGLRLCGAPEDVRVGDVVGAVEADFALVECFRPQTSHCVIGPACTLRGALAAAAEAFIAALNAYTLADLVEGRREMAALLSV